MSKSPLKGIDAFIYTKRPILRAATFSLICMLSLVNLCLISVSWSNVQFMRRDGSLTGALSVITSVVTMVISGMFAAATILREHAEADKEPTPMISERLCRDCIERLVSSLLTAWWLMISFNVSNMAFVFRDDLRQCTKQTNGTRSGAREESETSSPDSPAGACAVFTGSMVLSWAIWVLWVIRMWRSFTRANIHFDSRIFREPSEPIFDSYVSKCSRLQAPDASSPFSPSHPIQGSTTKRSIKHLELDRVAAPEDTTEINAQTYGQQSQPRQPQQPQPQQPQPQPQQPQPQQPQQPQLQQPPRHPPTQLSRYQHNQHNQHSQAPPPMQTTYGDPTSMTSRQGRTPRPLLAGHPVSRVQQSLQTPNLGPNSNGNMPYTAPCAPRMPPITDAYHINPASVGRNDISATSGLTLPPQAQFEATAINMSRQCTAQMPQNYRQQQSAPQQH